MQTNRIQSDGLIRRFNSFMTISGTPVMVVAKETLIPAYRLYKLIDGKEAPKIDESNALEGWLIQSMGKQEKGNHQKNIIMKSFAKENVKKLWKDSGQTQREFAKQFGIDPKAFWTYVSGTSEPNGIFLLRLCEHYSIDFKFMTEQRIKISAGNITNRPNQRSRSLVIRSAADTLIQEKKRSDRDFIDQMASLVREMESLAATRERRTSYGRMQAVK